MAKRIFDRNRRGTILKIFSILTLVILTAATQTCVAAFERDTQIQCEIGKEKAPITGQIQEESAIIYLDSKEIYKSKKDLKVVEIFCEDFNNDGYNELAFSLWKEGNYGSSKPFWVEKNDDSYKMHFFLYKYENSKILPLWHSSNLTKENIKIWPISSVKYGKIGILTLEKSYGKNFDYNLRIWTWRDFGFELVDELLTY